MASLGLAAVTHDESRLLAAAVLWLVLEQKVRKPPQQPAAAAAAWHTLWHDFTICLLYVGGEQVAQPHDL